VIKSTSVILGIGLIILWIAGLGSPNTTPWVTWLDGIGGIWAFLIAAGVSDRSGRGARSGNPIALAIGLFVLWIVALASHVVPWQSWWTFAFACAFLIVGIAGGAARPPRGQAELEQDRTRERFRRSA
jgi:peptidoglycan/LPS O-acetylase OafA/YrhL